MSITQVVDAYATLVAANLPYTKAQFTTGSEYRIIAQLPPFSRRRPLTLN